MAEESSALGELADRIRRLEERVTRLAGGQRPISAGSGGRHKAPAIGEFVRAKAPKGAPETALVIGAFLERVERLPSFNRADLEDGFRRSKLAVPVNLRETINKVVAKGHMTQAMEKKDKLDAFIVTQSGDDYVDAMTIRRRTK